jgi:hypothetical protein
LLLNSKAPKWLNVALGDSAEGMLTGKEVKFNTVFFQNPKEYGNIT